jgi:DNA-binding response OmpR family regulator
MTQSAAVAWIVAPAGRLSDGWRALLLALPEITDVRQVDSTSSALGATEIPGPDLVLLDAEALGERAWALLEQIRANAPRCRCIAVICSVHQRRIALAAGAEAVLIRGFSAAELSATVKDLLPPQEPAQ